MEPEAARHCKSGMAPRGTLPPHWVHSDQSQPNDEECCPFLQSSGDGGTDDQGRKERSEVDAAFLSWLRRQPGTVAAFRPRLQSGELFPAGGAAEERATLDNDDATGEGNQDRRQSRQPRPLHHLPDGRSRRVARAVCCDSQEDRATQASCRRIRVAKGQCENC